MSEQVIAVLFFIAFGVAVQFLVFSNDYPTSIDWSRCKKNFLARCKNLLSELEVWIDKIATINIEDVDDDDDDEVHDTIKDFAITEEGHFATSGQPRWTHPDTVRF